MFLIIETNQQLDRPVLLFCLKNSSDYLRIQDFFVNTFTNLLPPESRQPPFDGRPAAGIRLREHKECTMALIATETDAFDQEYQNVADSVSTAATDPEYDAWFRCKVAKSIQAVEAGHLLSSEEINQRA